MTLASVKLIGLLSAATLAITATALSAHGGHGRKSPAAKAPAPGPVLSEEQFQQTAGWDFAKAQIKTQKLTDHLYVLFGLGGNIAASVGEDGTLIVDDQFPQIIPKIKAALNKVGSKKVDFVINTHWHFDHADGNLVLGKEGSWIVSQKKSRDKMQQDNNINFGPASLNQKAYPKHALSDITFDRTMQFHLNGELIELLHIGPAHTTGDAAVIFRGSNAVHMGDVFNNAGYPFIDADNGGSITGMIAFCQAVYDSIDDKTRVIPGHGEVTTRAKLGRYIEILTTIRGRIRSMMDEGKTLAQITAAKPTAEFDKEIQANEFSTVSFISRSYASLVRE